MVGGLVRVNLPVSNWVAFVLLLLMPALLLRWRWWVAGLIIFLLLAVFVNFARSLWISMLVAFALEIGLFFLGGILNLKSALRIGLVPVMGVLALLLAPLVGLQSLGDSVAGRLAEGAQFFSAGLGTWADRVEQSQWTWDLLDQGYWLFGVGTDYYSFFGVPVDMGFPQTLLSVGIVGLVVFLGTMIVCFLAGIDGLKQGILRDDLFAVLACVGLPAVIVQRLVYQHWLYPESAGILAAAAAAALMFPYLPGDPQDESPEEPPEDPDAGNVPDDREEEKSTEEGDIVDR